MSKPSIIRIYDLTAKALKTHPVLFLPFIIFFIVDLISLILFSLAPRTPFNLFFAPPIRTFWGENFLHYPVNFLLLGKLTSISRMFLSIVLGSLLTGMAVGMVNDIYIRRFSNTDAAFKIAVKKYFDLVITICVISLLFYFMQKLSFLVFYKYFSAGHAKLLFLGPRFWLGPFLLLANFFIAILIQSAFVYVIPFLIIEKEKVFKATVKGIALFKKLFTRTLILVTMPMLFFVPILILQYKSDFLIDSVFPESVMLVLFLGAIVSSLVVDLLVTISATFLYLEFKQELRHTV